MAVRKVSPRRPILSARGVSRLSAHVESTCSTLVMSDQTLGIARGDGVHTCVHTPGVYGKVPVPGCEHRCEHLRHGRDLMSDRTSGTWRTCPPHGLTAWTRPDPTKWAVMVKDGARGREADLGRKHLIFRVCCPCAKYHHDGPFRRIGAFAGGHHIWRARAPRS